ncbi:MAG: hypothetical protein IPO89_10155 [Actinomycetales bacterium]|nr:hypothetical protein [Candidatus Lutibacillus vidarii]
MADTLLHPVTGTLDGLLLVAIGGPPMPRPLLRVLRRRLQLMGVPRRRTVVVRGGR